MSIDEISVMDGSKCILQLRGVRPFLSDKYDITKHGNYRYLSDSDPKNTFNIEKFVGTALKVDPNEKFTFVEDEEEDEPVTDIPAESFADYQPKEEAAIDEDEEFVFHEEDLEPFY
jgi:hypothetical protein